VPLVPAAPGSGGVSGDWVNEIHLTPGGYQKLGARMGPWIEQLLGQYP
jgi:lysophospholipase L1-like esterase